MIAVILVVISDAVSMFVTGEGEGEEGERIQCHRSRTRPSSLVPFLRLIAPRPKLVPRLSASVEVRQLRAGGRKAERTFARTGRPRPYVFIVI